MSLRTNLIAGVIGLSTVVPARAQKAAEIVTHNPVIENAVKDTVQVKRKVAKDISLRTFQFLNGNNITGVGLGFGTNHNKTSAYITPLAGYNFASKQPFIGGFGFLDRRYSNNNNKTVWLSQELYGEALKEKNSFDSKIAYTPVKLNTQLSKNVGLSFDPRVAVHINSNGFQPKVETLTTVSGPIYKNLSGYVLFQTYDTMKLFKEGSRNNMSVNGGIVWGF